MSAHAAALNQFNPAHPRVICRQPLNSETPLASQVGIITPTAAFYVRNHFPQPALAASDWHLVVEGEVAHPFALTYHDVRALPNRTLVVTLECAGNGRAYLQPHAEGEDWHYGAVGTAEWSGVPLGTVLEQAGLRATAREVVIEGADRGYLAEAGQTLSYARSLPREQALHPDTLLAYAMNGEPLPAAHGFPLRLIVPGWYGMASVKWVRRIEAIAQHFQGFFQVERYILTPPASGEVGKTRSPRYASARS